MNTFIISNDCSCYPFYDFLKLPYNHPFIGSGLLKESFLKIVSNLKNRDFDWFNITETIGKNYVSKIEDYSLLKLDQNIELNFVHHHFGHGVLMRYIRRITRMLNSIFSSNNIVIICHENRFCTNCFEELKDICSKNRFKLLYITNPPFQINRTIEEIFNKDVLKIAKSVRPGDVHTLILENEEYRNWIFENEKGE